MTSTPRASGTVNLCARDCWGIQAMLKFPTVMLSPVDHRPIFPVGVAPFLRVKVNHALLRFAQEPGLGYVAVDLNYAECWILDWIISAQSWDGADKLVVQILSVMAEHEMAGLHLRSKDEAGDVAWTREMDNELTAWFAAQGYADGNEAG